MKKTDEEKSVESISGAKKNEEETSEATNDDREVDDKVENDANCDTPELEDSVPENCQQEDTTQHDNDTAENNEDKITTADSEQDEKESTDATKEEEIKDDPKSEPCITKISLEEQEEDKDMETLSKDVDSIYLSETETDLVVNNFEDIDINAESDENEDNMTTPGLGGIHVIKIDDSKYNNGKKVIEISKDFLDTSNSDCEDSDVNTTREDLEDSVDTAPTREFNPTKRNKIEIATTDESYEQEKKKDKEAKRQVYF